MMTEGNLLSHTKILVLSKLRWEKGTDKLNDVHYRTCNRNEKNIERATIMTNIMELATVMANNTALKRE